MECVFASHAPNLPRIFWVMSKKPGTNHTQLAWQPELRPDIFVPTVYGPIEYRRLREQFIEIDRLLLGGIEADFVREVCSTLPPDCSARTLAFHAKNAVLALRCNLARKILRKGCNAFATHAADSELMRWFLCVGVLGLKSTPSKSTIDRLDKILPPARMRAFNQRLLARCRDAAASRALGLSAPVDF